MKGLAKEWGWMLEGRGKTSTFEMGFSFLHFFYSDRCSDILAVLRKLYIKLILRNDSDPVFPEKPCGNTHTVRHLSRKASVVNAVG